MRRAERRAELRREAPAEGTRRRPPAELTAELRAERRLAEQAERERAERRRRADAPAREDRAPSASWWRAAERAAAALERARERPWRRAATSLAAELEADAALGDSTAAELRACAQEEAELQERLSEGAEAVTAAEVSAQQARDRAAEHDSGAGRIAARLGLDPEPAEERARRGRAAPTWRRASSGSPAAASSSAR